MNININLFFETLNESDNFINNYKIEIVNEIPKDLESNIYENDNYIMISRQKSIYDEKTYLTFIIDEKEIFSLLANNSQLMDIFHRIGKNLYLIIVKGKDYKIADELAIKEIKLHTKLMRDINKLVLDFFNTSF